MILNGLIRLAEILRDLAERFTPHTGQIPIGRAIFYNGFKKIFCVCGRSFGKSRIAAYIVTRIARENPNTTNFVFGPYIGQMKEIYWTTKLIHNLIPEDEIESVNATEMRITLTNGSFIRVCGTDNYESFRGIKLNPKSIAVIEEAKDVRKEFLDVFLPNLSTNDPTLMMIGTPPYRENHFIQYMNHAKNDPEWFYYHAPSSVNPHVSRKFLSEQKAFLEKNGMMDVWLSEYEAQYTLGGHRSVFPMVPGMPIKTREEMWPKDSNKWRLFVGFDPASTSVFAIVFFLYNPYRKKVIPVGEIYENRPEFMTARKIYDAVNERLMGFRALGIAMVEFVYDSAAAWFANEIRDIDRNGDWWLLPCDKSNGLQGEISCWRGVLAHGHFEWSDATPKLRWEMENYILDEKGRLPDKDDHCIEENQLVTTMRGEIPIKDIEVGDYALTRGGFNKVLEKYDKGIQEIIELSFSDGKKLLCTEDHEIFTQRGFIEASQLTNQDIFYSVEQCLLRKSSLTELNSDVIQIAKDQITEDIILAQRSTVVEALRDIYTERFGNSTMVQFLMDFIFIIKTMISITIPLRISNVFQNQITIKNIEKDLFLMEKDSLNQDISTELESYQSHGTKLHKELNYTRKTEKFLNQKIEQNELIIASIAEKNIKQTVLFGDQCFVVQIAPLRIEENLELMTQIEHAQNAEKCLELTSTQEKFIAPVLVGIRKKGYARVFDLSIENHHEFFASGILVHNCWQAGAYILKAMGFDFTESLEPRTVEDKRRAVRIDEEFVNPESLQGID